MDERLRFVARLLEGEKMAAVSYRQPTEEDRYMLDTRDIVAGMGMSDKCTAKNKKITKK
jgi:hypothetical protein